MFCKNCGSQIDDSAVVCPHCGASTGSFTGGGVSTTNENNTMAIVGFILSFFVAIAGLICSIIGLKRAPQFGGKGKGMAIAGIILSALSMFFSFIIFIVSFMNTLNAVM